MRLQNVPSEDEQHEFNIRMRRDIRSRRRLEGGNSAGTDEDLDPEQQTRRSTRQKQPLPPATPQSTDDQVNRDRLIRKTYKRRKIILKN